MRKNIRKAYEFLERDGHKFVFRVVDQPADVHTAVNRFFTLHVARADATDMNNYHPNRFQTPRNRNFMMDYAHQTAKKGQLCLLELEIDGDVVGSRLGFKFGSELYLYFSGFDLSWKKYSIMILLMSETIKWAIQRGLKVVNLSTGNDQSKLRWRPVEIMFYDANQMAPTVRALLLVPVYEALRRQFGASSELKKLSKLEESRKIGPLE